MKSPTFVVGRMPMSYRRVTQISLTMIMWSNRTEPLNNALYGLLGRFMILFLTCLAHILPTPQGFTPHRYWHSGKKAETVSRLGSSRCFSGRCSTLRSRKLLFYG